MSSLTRNTIANYVGQGYTILIGIVMLPLYLKYLGAEAYGLVGFFTVMQAWFGLLDMGLTPALSRQVANLRGKSEGLVHIWSLLRSTEWLFGWLAVSIATSAWLASTWIANHWLTIASLEPGEVAYCISLMGFMVGLRWFGSLYRGGIQGMEQMIWLNAANIGIATARFVGAYALLRWISPQPAHFFEFQLTVSILEFSVLALRFYGQLPSNRSAGWGFSWLPIREVLPFAGGIAYTSSLWVLLTQTDKLILSHTLTLREYGYFALVATVANGLLSLAGPVSQAILPRMTHLLSEGREPEMIMLYRKATRLVAGVIFPITGVIALFSEQILLLWTGNREASTWAGPVLMWFVLGNGILTVGSFPYYLQFAHGKLRLHVINSTISALLQIPLLAVAAVQFGAIGVAYAWCALRLITFIAFTAIVHHRFSPGLHNAWLLSDLLPMLCISCVVLGATRFLLEVYVVPGTMAVVALILAALLTMGISTKVNLERMA